MSIIVNTLGPADHGRRMPLADFEPAECQEGYLYELSRGVVQVMQVPKPPHALRIQSARDQFVVYKLANPGRIRLIAAGSDCRIAIADFNSERHPDLAIYMTEMPTDENPWAVWIPEIVIEIVSAGSEIRDYQEKPDEYLRFGIREYWVIDPRKREMLVLRRSRGRWSQRTIQAGEAYRTRLLPAFEFDCQAVFDAAPADE